jgi:hypothetical protein
MRPAVVVCIVVYNAAFGMSFGPIPWLYPPEVGLRQLSTVATGLMRAFAFQIMPLPFRAKGVSLSTATVSPGESAQRERIFLTERCFDLRTGSSTISSES